MTAPPVAILADAHVHTAWGDYGLPGLPVGSRRLTLRSWHDTARAARVFNESAAAFDAALEQIAAGGIRHVVLLGDYTDDGQAETTRRFAAHLHGWQARGLRFYAIPGNHDLWGPHGKHTATRFLTAPGQTVRATSDPDLADEPGTVVTPALRCLGLSEALAPMAPFGLTRQPHHHHWESPFGTSDRFEDRRYPARSRDGQTVRHLIDASYLVEPEPGLWLLMLDANVFEPRDGAWRETQKRAFLDPASAGWTALLRVKPFLLGWIAEVTARAERQGKALLAFSHYPVLDPFEDAAGHEAALFGETEVVRRTPAPDVAAALAAAGLRHHFSGHIHADGTVRAVTPHGAIVNEAVPSPVAFPPAYKIARASSEGPQVRTVPLDLPRDPTLIDLYRAEPDAPELLAAPGHAALLLGQARRRAGLRVARDWPPALQTALAGATGLHLAALMRGAASLATPPDATALATAGLPVADLAALPLSAFAADWYLLRQGGPLARAPLAARLPLYRRLAALPPAEHCPEAAFFSRILAVLAVSLARADRGG